MATWSDIAADIRARKLPDLGEFLVITHRGIFGLHYGEL